MGYALASNTGIRELYHYQKSELPWLETLISNGMIKFSNSASFNDPWDCRPCFNSDAVDDIEYRNRHINWFKQIGRANRPDLSEEEHLRRDERLKDKNFLRGLINRASDTLPDEIYKRYRVYCLTHKPDNVLMWAHYADNHKGVCLKFETRNAVFSAAFKIDYQQDYPTFDLADNELDNQLLPFITKSQSWSYEEEYRLIAQERAHAIGLDTLITEKDFLVLPEKALTGINLGHKITDSDEYAIRNLMKSNPALKLGHARPVRNKYSLEISWAD